MITPLRDIAAAILAGGQATRMGGRPKSFLPVEGVPIIDRQLAVLRPLFAELFIVANDATRYADLGLPVVPDAVPNVGPLGGILAAVERARAERVVVVACDMPYLTAEAVALIAGADAAEDVVVPVVDGRPEPLLARYGRACAPAIRARLAAGERKIARFFDDVRVHRVTEERLRALDAKLTFLRNCNTPDDLV